MSSDRIPRSTLCSTCFSNSSNNKISQVSQPAPLVKLLRVSLDRVALDKADSARPNLEPVEVSLASSSRVLDFLARKEHRVRASAEADSARPNLEPVEVSLASSSRVLDFLARKEHRVRASAEAAYLVKHRNLSVQVCSKARLSSNS